MKRILLGVFALLSLLSLSDARHMRKEEIKARQVEAAKRWTTTPPHPPFFPGHGKGPGFKNITFKNPKAKGA